MSMPFVIIWIVQMLVFFLFIIGIALFFTKTVKKNTKEQQRERPAVKDYKPIQERRQEQQELKEQLSRNQSAKNNRNRNNRSVRSEKKQQENDTIANRRRRREESTIGSVVTFTSTEQEKNKKVSIPLNKKNLKQALMYKEILDKPLSLREDSVE